MPVVVADTGPLQYLVLIDQIELMPRLFAAVTIPTAAQAEMLDPAAPEAVRTWAAAPPRWLTVSPAPSEGDATLQRLGAGERTAIALALSIGAKLIVMDDRAASPRRSPRHAWRPRPCGPRGHCRPPGSLREAESNFRYPPALLDTMLAAWRRDRGT